MIRVAIWRDPAHGRYRGLVRFLDRDYPFAGSSLDLVVLMVETEIGKRVPAFVELEFHYVDLGWRSDPTPEEIDRELKEAAA